MLLGKVVVGMLVHKVADKFVYLCMIGAVPDARKHHFMRYSMP